MKLEVGMYVRTKDGYISQYKYYNTTNMGKLLCIPLNNGTFANIEDIVKASHNIIDLIEVGDYVNNERVEEIWKEIVLVGQECRPISFNNIKSIVTKEQFESMKYSLEG